MIQSHASIQELLAGYALDALADDEAREVAAHLRSCGECRRILDDYQQVAEGLAHSVPMRTAPPGMAADLRIRVAQATPAARRRQQMSLAGLRPNARAMAAGVALLVVLAAGVWLGFSEELVEIRQARAILASDTAMRVDIVPDGIASEASGEVVLTEDGRTLVVAVEGLPLLPDDQVYQLWLIEGDVRASGGTYPSNKTLWLVDTPQSLTNYESVGVTIEPRGGSPAPTGPRVLRADLPAMGSQ